MNYSQSIDKYEFPVLRKEYISDKDKRELRTRLGTSRIPLKVSERDGQQFYKFYFPKQDESLDSIAAARYEMYNGYATFKEKRWLDILSDAAARVNNAEISTPLFFLPSISEHRHKAEFSAMELEKPFHVEVQYKDYKHNVKDSLNFLGRLVIATPYSSYDNFDYVEAEHSEVVDNLSKLLVKTYTDPLTFIPRAVARQALEKVMDAEPLLEGRIPAATEFVEEKLVQPEFDVLNAATWQFNP